MRRYHYIRIWRTETEARYSRDEQTKRDRNLLSYCDMRSSGAIMRSVAGVLTALEFLAQKVAKRAGIDVSVRGDAGVRLPAAVETALYRIVQEAFNNAIRHAAARSVRIELQCTPYTVKCSVCDDGRGFDANRPPHTQGLGLIGIRERVSALGGSLRLVTEPLNGTTIQTEIPLGG